MSSSLAACLIAIGMCRAEPLIPKYRNLSVSESTAVGYTIRVGYTPGHHQGATSTTPSARPQHRSGTGGRRQPKCSNSKRLRDQPKSRRRGRTRNETTTPPTADQTRRPATGRPFLWVSAVAPAGPPAAHWCPWCGRPSAAASDVLAPARRSRRPRSHGRAPPECSCSPAPGC